MDFQKMIDYRNAKSPFSQHMGIRLTELGPGCAKTVKTVAPEDLNPLHYAHGGVYFSLADTACGSAMAAYGTMAVTVNCSFSFLKSARAGDRLTAEARALQGGRSICVLEARELPGGRSICVLEARVTGEAGELFAVGTFTFRRLEKPIGP